jgi:hypothetical protein
MPSLTIAGCNRLQALKIVIFQKLPGVQTTRPVAISCKTTTGCDGQTTTWTY